MMSDFSDLLGSIRFEKTSAFVRIPDAWSQGRSSFGGLQAAVALCAARACVPSALPLRTMQATFIGPLANAVEAKARVLRSGKNVIHVQVELCQLGGQSPAGGATLAALLIFVFGAARNSQVVRKRQMPVWDAQLPSQKLPQIAGLTPNFCREFDADWLHGGLPFSGSSEPDCVVNVAMRDREPASEAHVIAFADYLPPIAFSHLRAPAVGSSLTWMLEMFGNNYAEQSVVGWRVDAELLAASNGYTSQSCKVWDPTGNLAAIGQQGMVVFA